ncbi:unnamed protein product [Ceutorhynchus assimilis]|uniref:Uncharacterized protein n=1 Tax=Ceutorhynchus assimilis TaxID=467358 RepID=A0A9N9MDA7_9CUCU|nr:unnamed protein product [Ceutorhynchus assimilis]
MLVINYIVLCFIITLSFGLQCRDENNNPVDWYVIYKLPKQAAHKNDFIKQGLAFMYMTSNDYSKWTLSKVNINDTSSMVAHTLSGLYNNKEENLYIVYNDQPPCERFERTASQGHTKGVVMSDVNEGFLLTHSVPHYPYNLEHYEYPTTGTHYGQSFLCISLGMKYLNIIGLQLQYNEPHIFAQNTPESLKNILPELFKAANHETVKMSPWFNVENITSLGGTKFTSFAKSGKFDKDLYANLVGAYLQSNLYVETWPNEPNRLPSDCDGNFHVDNILSISVPEPSISFKTASDHSKWAVSTVNDSLKWLCIGDINRAEKQTKRGGGTTCINNEKLASQYLNIVSSVEQCKSEHFYEIISNSIE